MRGFGKSLRLLALCVILVCSLSLTVFAAPVENCPGSCTHQAAVGTTHYDTLQEAVQAAAGGSTVTLLTDMTLSAPIVLDKMLTLDLGGKTLTGTPGSDNQVLLTFTKGGSVRNGTMDVTTGSALEAVGCTVIIETNAVLTGRSAAPVVLLTASEKGATRVNVSGTVTGKGPAPAIYAASAQKGTCDLSVLKSAKITAEAAVAIELNCAGALNVAGNLHARKDCIQITIHDQQVMKLAVTGGKHHTETGTFLTIRTLGDAVEPKDFVTGGTFNKVPTAYVPAYCQIRDNGDGTYTVISSYSLSFLPGDGSGSMQTIEVQCGSAVKLPKCTFTAPSGMDFAGWEIGGTVYAAGDTYTPTSDTTATAQWKTHVHSGGKATCLKKAVCEGCGKAYGKRGSHNLSASSGYAATCTQDGMNAHSRCKTCNKYFVSGVQISPASLTIPAFGHSWQTVDGNPATCTEDGLLSHEKCVLCDLLQVDGATVTESSLLIPATGHQLEAVATTQATCSQPGIQAHEHCALCDGQFLEGLPVEAAQLTTALSSHVLSDWRTDEHAHWKACVDCEEVFRQGSHKDNNADGACDDCGEAMAVQPTEPVKKRSGFSWLFLTPLIAAVAIAVPLAIKKRK